MIYSVRYTCDCYGVPMDHEFFRTNDINEAHRPLNRKNCVACDINVPGYPGTGKCKIKYIVKELTDL